MLTWVSSTMYRADPIPPPALHHAAVHRPPPSDWARARAIAARAECDWRTALRALRADPSAIRTRAVRERLRAVLAEMGITPGGQQ